MIQSINVIHCCQQQCKPEGSAEEKHGRPSWMDWANSDPASAGLRASVRNTSCNDQIWPRYRGSAEGETRFGSLERLDQQCSHISGAEGANLKTKSYKPHPTTHQAYGDRIMTGLCHQTTNPFSNQLTQHLNWKKRFGLDLRQDLPVFL